MTSQILYDKSYHVLEQLYMMVQTLINVFRVRRKVLPLPHLLSLPGRHQLKGSQTDHLQVLNWTLEVQNPLTYLQWRVFRYVNLTQEIKDSLFSWLFPVMWQAARSKMTNILPYTIVLVMVCGKYRYFLDGVRWVR